MTTSKQRIMEALRRWPGLDDDLLARQSDVQPRQQVNQICRRLERQGVIRRVVGPNGKIGNWLTGATAPEATRAPASVKTLAQDTSSKRSHESREYALDTVLQAALIVIPCSKSKEPWIGAQETGFSILDDLPIDLGTRLRSAREAMRAFAKVDETSLVAAWKRYSGSLYKSAASSLRTVDRNGLHLLILSGGYGLVRYDEPIGNYEARFHVSDWPRGLLEEAIIQYVRRHNLTSVRAIASSSTDYFKLLRQVRWRDARVSDVLLMSPQATQGAMIRSPRAQGEALGALLHGRMTSSWVSSDGLRMDISTLA
jgi:hypothetical protein